MRCSTSFGRELNAIAAIEKDGYTEGKKLVLYVLLELLVSYSLRPLSVPQHPDSGTRPLISGAKI
jgi:hypothetical protein